MRVIRMVRGLLVALALALSLVPGPAAWSSELGLSQAVREALDSNLDLAAQRRALAADREQIDIARSGLLPQVNLGAKATYLDADRTHDGRGNTSQESVTVGAGLEQVLYDDEVWASFQIQQQVYVEQQSQLEAFELGIVQDAATAFLELDRSRALLSVEEQNRALTASNLETSRARIAAGYSSEREVLRWESQLASNDRSVVGARTQLLSNRFMVNRLRNQPVEAALTPLPARIEEYGFVYSRARLVEAIESPEGDRRLRDYLVRVGIARSSELVGLDAAIAAAQRLNTASQRSFWVPTLSFGAGVDHLAFHGQGSPNFNQTEWAVGAGLAFPLFEGGAKFAQLSQTREGLASLGFQRRSAAQEVEQAVRQTFAEASGAYASLGLAGAQESAARRNFELVGESYTLGVASILSLLDAQSQLLAAQQAVTDAHYGFLEDLIAAERAISLYPFLEAEAEMDALLEGLERELAPER